jgi:hypothetical protein
LPSFAPFAFQNAAETLKSSSLMAVLTPGQTFAYWGALVRFASLDKATASARITLCIPAPVTITTVKPTRLPSGVGYPVLVLKGGSCGTGRTFKGVLALLVTNPSGGCGPVPVPRVQVGHHDPEYTDDASGSDVRDIPG